MNETTDQAWQLLRQSQLVPSSQIDNLILRYQSTQPQGTNGSSVVPWLISQKLITQYQGQVLAAGRSGPFLYGEYKVYDRVTGGPFDACFRAVHALTGHPVLLKFLSGAAVTDSNVWSRISQQIQVHATVTHPNVLRCFELCDLGSYKFVVIEDRIGTQIGQLLDTGKRFDVVNASQIIQSAAIGLHAIHLQNQVHANLSSKALYLGADGLCWVYRDPLQWPYHPLRTGSLSAEESIALADYVAPELGLPTNAPNALTDIYGLGCLFYELLSNNKPYPGGDIRSKVSRHATSPTQPLEPLGVPAGVEQLIRFMMAKDPNLRYRSMETVANQLVPFSGKPALANPMPATNSLNAFERHLAQKRSGGQPATSSVPAAVPLVPSAPAAPVISTQAAPPAIAVSGVVPPPPPRIQPAAGPAIASAVTGPPPVSPPATKSMFDVQRDTSAKALIRKKGPSVSTLIGLGVTVLLLLIALFFIMRSMNSAGQIAEDGDDTEEVADSDNPEEIGDVTEVKTDTPVVNRDPNAGVPQNVVADDGRTLWETPTVGFPIDLNYVPADMRALISVRPAEIYQTPDGALVFRSLGEDFTKLQSDFEKQSGVPLNNIEHLLLTIHSNAGKAPRPSFVITLANPLPKDTLLGQWKNPKPTPIPDKNVDYYPGAGEVAYLIPTDGITPGNEVKRFVMTGADQIKEMAERDFAPPNVSTQVRQMLTMTDATRHFTAVSAPSFLFNDEGARLFNGPSHAILDALKSLISLDVQAGIFSMHLQDDWYLELMLKGQLDKDPYQMGNEFKQRFTDNQKNLALYVAGLNNEPYWAQVRMLFAVWTRQIIANMRTGVEDRIMIANCWMPRPAAHNIIAGTELVLATTGGGSSNTGGEEAVAVADKPAPKSLEELLEVEWEVEIPENDMVLSVDEIRDGLRDAYKEMPFNFDIIIIGKDLQTDGITKNRKIINFKMKSKLRDVLTSLVVTAYADKLVKGPSDPLQKLIWVIGPDTNKPEEKAILITTRKAAERDKIELPAEFVPKKE